MPVQVTSRRAITVNDSGTMTVQPKRTATTSKAPPPPKVIPVRSGSSAGRSGTSQGNSFIATTATGRAAGGTQPAVARRGNLVSRTQAVIDVTSPHDNSVQTRSMLNRAILESETIPKGYSSGSRNKFLYAQRDDLDDGNGSDDYGASAGRQHGQATITSIYGVPRGEIDEAAWQHRWVGEHYFIESPAEITSMWQELPGDQEYGDRVSRYLTPRGMKYTYMEMAHIVLSTYADYREAEGEMRPEQAFHFPEIVRFQQSQAYEPPSVGDWFSATSANLGKAALITYGITGALAAVGLVFPPAMAAAGFTFQAANALGTASTISSVTSVPLYLVEGEVDEAAEEVIGSSLSLGLPVMLEEFLPAFLRAGDEFLGELWPVLQRSADDLADDVAQAVQIGGNVGTVLGTGGSVGWSDLTDNERFEEWWVLRFPTRD